MSGLGPCWSSSTKLKMEGDKRRDVTNYYTQEQELHMLIWGYWGQVSCFLLLTFEEAKKK